MTRSVDRLLTGLLVLLLLACTAGAMPGLYLVGSDLQTSGEFLDGIGVVLGLGVVGLAGVPAAAAVMAIRSLRRGRPSARRWVVGALRWPRPSSARMTALLVACAVGTPVPPGGAELRDPIHSAA